MVKPLFERHPLPWRQMADKPGFLIDNNGTVVAAFIGHSREELSQVAAHVVAAVDQRAALVNALRGLLQYHDSQRVSERLAAKAIARAALKLAEDVPVFQQMLAADPKTSAADTTGAERDLAVLQQVARQGGKS